MFASFLIEKLCSGKDQYLIDLSDRNNLGGKGSSVPPQMGFIGYPTVPPLPQMPPPPSNKPFNYPPYAGAKGAGGNSNQSPFNYNIPPTTSPTQIIDEKKDLNTQFINVSWLLFSLSLFSLF